MAKKDFDTAFRAAHTLKGVCSTLGFQNLFTISSQLTEALRNRDEIDINEAILLFEKLQPAYFNTIKLINCIE
jgi:HPt (histidine-containing phosphotransfer) domain-containing protein